MIAILYHLHKHKHDFIPVKLIPYLLPRFAEHFLTEDSQPVCPHRHFTN